MQRNGYLCIFSVDMFWESAAVLFSQIAANINSITTVTAANKYTKQTL